MHITFLLILPAFTWLFAYNPEPLGFRSVSPDGLKYLLSASAAVLLFFCILLHELGHSYIAKKNNIKISSITLFIFGGVSQIEDIPRNPKVEFTMALTGPLVSLLIGVVLLAVYFLFRPILSLGSPYLLLIFLVGIINIVLGVFNLIPAFPMDGGRVLRAIFARHRNYIMATRSAVSIGKILAILMGFFGLIANPWLILIAFFIYIGASEEEKATELSVLLEGVKVRDIMSTNVVTVTPDITIAQLVRLLFEKKHMGYPVVHSDKLVGVVTFSDVQKVQRENWDSVRVSQVMTKDVITLKPDDESIDAYKLLSTHKIGRILIKDNGNVVGIISRTDLFHASQIQTLR